MSALVISAAYSAAWCLAVHNKGPQPRGQTCLFLRSQKQAPHRARLPELGLCSQDSKVLSWNQRGLGTGDHEELGARYGFGGSLAVTWRFYTISTKIVIVTTAPAVLSFWFILILLILVPTTRNPGPSLIPMGGEYKTFLGVPCSFFLHGWQWFFCSWAVPGGLGGMKVGMSMVHLTLCSNLYRALHIFTHRTSLQASMSN